MQLQEEIAISRLQEDMETSAYGLVILGGHFEIIILVQC